MKHSPYSADSIYTSIEHQAVQTRLLVSVIELGYFINILEICCYFYLFPF